MLARLDYCQRTSLAKSLDFTATPRGIVQDFLTINKGEPILNEQEIRASLLKVIDTLETKANALVSELQKEAARTWRDYLQPT